MSSLSSTSALVIVVEMPSLKARQTVKVMDDVSTDTALDAKVDIATKHTPEIVARLEWLMFFRVLLVTLLLGSTLIFRLTAQDALSESKRLGLLGLIVGTYALTIVYAVLLRSLQRHYGRFAYVQITGDGALARCWWS